MYNILSFIEDESGKDFKTFRDEVAQPFVKRPNLGRPGICLLAKNFTHAFESQTEGGGNTIVETAWGYVHKWRRKKMGRRKEGLKGAMAKASCVECLLRVSSGRC